MSSTYPLEATARARFVGELVMVTPEAHKAVGLAHALPGLRVLTAAEAEACAPLEAAGARVVRVEGVPDGSTRALVESPEGRAALRSWAPARAVLFRVDHATVQLIEDTGVAVLGSDPQVARGLENKERFRRAMGAAGLPVVPCVSGTWTGEGLDADVPFGWPRIVQSPRGYAGRRTWRWDEGAPEPGLGELTGRSALVAPMLSGPTWTINACAYPDGVVVGAPMRQVDGDPRLATGAFSSAGATFGAPGGDAVAATLRELARRVGELAAQRGFRGFFGIDTVEAEAGLVLIEMNPRLTATLTMATLAELRAGRTPLTVHALFAWAGASLADLAGERGAAVDSEPIDVAASGHLIVRDTGRPVRRVEAGSYRVAGEGGMVRVGPAPSGLPAGVGEVAIWPAGPRAGGPEDDRLRLLFAEGVVAERGLRGIAEAAVTWALPGE